MPDRVGFVGLGTMGRPMAINLVRAGYALKVFNRTRERTKDAVDAGAEAVGSAREAADGADVVVTMLSDSSAVREVVLGSGGVIEGCRPGAVVADMSTISPDVARDIASECRRRGVSFLDAPVTGGEKGAIDATLSVMVGGSPDALEKARPVLRAMCSTITYMGESGSGQAAKLCNQVVCGLNILAICEGLALGRAAGLDLTTLLSAIAGGAAGSWMLSNLAPRMVDGDWAPGFRVALQQKDLRLALESAQAGLVPLPGTALVQQLFRVAEARGWGDEGTQSLYKVMVGLGSDE